MILCLTPNPAVDRILQVPSLCVGNVQRAEKVMVAAGGKGLNVARTIHTLGGEALCLGFLGGHTGRLLADLTQQEGLKSLWTWTGSETRTCTILISEEGDATVINEPGLPISETDWERLQQDIHAATAASQLMCISGSWPPGSSMQHLRELFEMLIEAGKQVWVDTSGAALEAVLGCPGLCVKVNGGEIGAVLGFEVNDLGSAKRALTMLGELGMPAGVITLGAAGALLATAQGRWLARSPKLHVVSSVGSGDAFLGGLVQARQLGRDWETALRAAAAAGAANVLSAVAGQFSLEQFDTLREQIQIQTW